MSFGDVRRAALPSLHLPLTTSCLYTILYVQHSLLPTQKYFSGLSSLQNVSLYPRSTAPWILIFLFLASVSFYWSKAKLCLCLGFPTVHLLMQLHPQRDVKILVCYTIMHNINNKRMGGGLISVFLLVEQSTWVFDLPAESLGFIM